MLVTGEQFSPNEDTRAKQSLEPDQNRPAATPIRTYKANGRPVDASRPQTKGKSVTTAILLEPPDAPQAVQFRMDASVISQADAVGQALCDSKHGCGTYRAMPQTERRVYFSDGMAAVRGRSVTARQVAVTRAAEAIFTAEMTRKNHRADWRNLEPNQRAWYVEQAGAAISVYLRSLEGELDPQGSR